MKKIMKAAWKHTKRFFKDFKKNFEALIILTFSAIGIASVLSEIPFLMELPKFFNPATTIPAIATLIVIGLVIRLEKKAKRWKV